MDKQKEYQAFQVRLKLSRHAKLKKLAKEAEMSINALLNVLVEKAIREAEL